MLTARSPVRIDFAGGTTDISPFCDEEGGCVINAAINVLTDLALQIVKGNIQPHPKRIDATYNTGTFIEVPLVGSVRLIDDFLTEPVYSTHVRCNRKSKKLFLFCRIYHLFFD